MDDSTVLREGLHVLPLELIEQIISYLQPTDALNFIFADYSFLRQLGVAPDIPRAGGDRASTPFERLPTELLLLILSILPPPALISLALAFYHHLRARGIAGPIIKQ